jgi:hypothetical protein
VAGVPFADVGFGVGHTRETETKGIWVWGEPKTIKDGNGERMVRYSNLRRCNSTLVAASCLAAAAAAQNMQLLQSGVCASTSIQPFWHCRHAIMFCN